MSKKSDKKAEVTATKAQIAEFEGFCAAIGMEDQQAAACKACKQGEGYPKGMYDHCLTLVDAKAKEKADKKVIKIGGKIRPKYNDFADLKKHLTDVVDSDDLIFTMKVNKLLLTSHTLENLHEKIGTMQVGTYKDNKDFKNVGTLKRHLQWLAARGWVFTFTKDKKVKLTDYTPGKEATITFPAKKEEKKIEEKKAA